MDELTILDKLQILKIKTILRLNQIIHRNQLPSQNRIEKWGRLENIAKYLEADRISIQLYKKDENKKAYILELIELLRKNGIDIELIEFEKIFNDEDMKTILEKNPDTEINLRYIIKSYFAGSNIDTTYAIGDYCKILDKIEYLGKVAKANFKSEDEQVMFVITQLSNYISVDEKYKQQSEEELKVTSSLKGALLERKTVCIGYAMALERCLTNLGIESDVLIGVASREKQPEISLNSINHAWNRVKLNNEWYNVDLTFFVGSEDLDYILVDDTTFEGHYIPELSGYDTVPCNNSYSRRQEIYEKVRNIKNVLTGYDRGKRTTMLQYEVPNIQNENSYEEERRIVHNYEIEHDEIH